MAEQMHSSSLSETEWQRELTQIRHGIATPGYWRTLEENCAQWAKTISVCAFWTKAAQQLRQWIGEYRTITGGALLADVELPNFCGKSADSIQSKLYRHRRNQENFDAVFSKDGPPVPKLNDLVRTRISCKYIDGLEFLANKLLQLAQNMKLNPKRNRQGRLEGYFAQHVYFTEDVFFRFGRDNQPATITCEIQLASDLATRILEAAHVVYAGTR